MWQKEGLVGFFKGNGMTILKIAPFSAIEFYCYEVFKSTLFPNKERHEFTYMDKILCGGLTGITAQTVTYPLDLLKTYMTINVENNMRVSMGQQARMIVAKNGFLGMYQGLGTSCAGIAPFIGIKMASYDFLMQKFGPKKG